MTANTPIAAPDNHARNSFELLGVMPEDQELLTVPPDTPVAEALDLMHRHGYSQVPISPDGKRVDGVFSHESFAQTVTARARNASRSKPFDPLSLTVDECRATKRPFASLNDLFTDWLDDLKKQGFILVAAHGRVQAMVTPTDVLDYLYKVASPYVLIADCEFSIRAIIRRRLSPDGIAQCARQCLDDKYPADKIPVTLEDMTFDDYVRIVTDGRWNHFNAVFGQNRTNTRSRLDNLRELRNQIFHHRGDVTPPQHESLFADRGWLIRKVDAITTGEDRA